MATLKRSRHEIISQILNVCQNGASKTRIVYQANLNFRTVNPYLNLLIEKGLLEIKQEKPAIYETTELGMDMLDNLKKISSQIDVA